MARRDVIALLREAFSRQHLEEVQINGSEVARYLKSRYSITVSGEEEEGVPNKFQESRLPLSKKQEVPLTRAKKSVSLLQTLRNKKKINKGLMNSPPPAFFTPLSEGRSTKKEASLERELPQPVDLFNLKETYDAPVNKSKQVQPPNRGPWPQYRSKGIAPLSNTSLPGESIATTKTSVKSQKKPTKLSALGESKLRIVIERKERKDRQVAGAKMEARQAKIAELKARAEAALSKARSLLNA